jgi:hypothetical protein
MVQGSAKLKGKPRSGAAVMSKNSAKYKQAAVKAMKTKV